jgi:hypothetical protein
LYYKQTQRAPIENHCTKWENLLHQMILPITEKRKVQLFAWSLYDTQVKVTITTRYADTLATAIEAAIWIINDCQLAPVANQTDTEAEAEAMEWTNAQLYNVQVQQMHHKGPRDICPLQLLQANKSIQTRLLNAEVVWSQGTSSLWILWCSTPLA